MKIVIKRVMLFLIVLVMFTQKGKAAFSLEKYNYKACILIEANSGKILYEYNKDRILPEASITKLMTYYAFMDFLKKNGLNETDRIKINTEKFNVPKDGSQIYLKKGDVLTIKDIINSMLILSANDSAMESKFILERRNSNIIDSMNKLSRAMGLVNSRYYNVTGLTITEGNNKIYNVTTVYELAKLASRVIKEYPEIIKTTSKKEYHIKGRTFQSTNKLLFTMPGVDGLKTGHTREAGYCLAATLNATKEIGNGKPIRLVAILLGCPTDALRFSEASKLLNYGLNNFINDRIVKSTEQIKINNEFYKHGRIIAAGKDLYLLKERNAKIIKDIKINDNLPRKIFKGDKIGSINILSGQEKFSCGLYAAENTELRPGILRFFLNIKNFIKNMFH